MRALWISLALVALIARTSAAFVAMPADSLCALYRSAGGSRWLNATYWCTSQPVCDWFGVGCDEVTGEVVTLVLRANRLSGVLPIPFLPHLTELVALDLSLNRLPLATFPDLRHLQKLRYLELVDTQIRGQLPSFAEQRDSLEYLRIVGADRSSAC
jgi:hypothetical protein